MIRGTIKDQNGTPLGGTEIEAKNVANGVSRTTTSGQNGSYVLPGLVPAAYDLIARHVGYTPQRRRVDVQIGATMLADFALAQGAVELQPITVTAASPAIQ